MRTPLVWVLAITVLWAVGAIGFYYGDAPARADIVFLATNAFAALLAALVTSIAAFREAKSSAQNVRMGTLNNTFAYLEKWDSPLLMQARDLIRKYGSQKNQLSKKTVLDAIKQDQGIERSVITILNFFQDVKLSCDHDRVLEPILRRAFARPYVELYELFELWITEMNRRDPEEGSDLKSLYSQWKVVA